MKPLLAGLLVLGVSSSALAQTKCVAPDGSNEATTMAIKSVPVAFSATRAPKRLAAGKVELGLEVMTVPDVDSLTNQPTVCGTGRGLENTNQLVLAAEPRVRVGIGSGFAAEAGWVPPIPVSGVTANLFGFSFGWTSMPFGALVVEIRGNAAFGTVSGAFTCTEARVQDPTSTCFGGSVSDDKFKPGVYGADVLLGGNFAEGRLRPYLGGGYAYLSPSFEVNRTDRFGNLDNTIVVSTMSRATITGGVTFDISKKISLTGQYFTFVSDGSSVSVTFRAQL